MGHRKSSRPGRASKKKKVDHHHDGQDIDSDTRNSNASGKTIHLNCVHKEADKCTFDIDTLTGLPSAQFVKNMDKYYPDPLPVELIFVVPDEFAGNIMNLTAYHDCIIDDLNKALPVAIKKHCDLLRTSLYYF